MRSIERALTFSNGEFSTLETHSPFTAIIGENNDLVIETKTNSCILEEDDLRGVWLELQSGLVTKQKAGWSDTVGGEPLLSLLSILPSFRPVQIQRPGQSEPEFAVEPRPEVRGATAANQTPKQHELAWH